MLLRQALSAPQKAEVLDLLLPFEALERSFEDLDGRWSFSSGQLIEGGFLGSKGSDPGGD